MTSSSLLLHLLRNNMDNDISGQNVEESLGINELQGGEKKIAQSSTSVIEETGISWLQQASENKARSYTPKIENVINFDQRVSVTNAIQENENKRTTSTTAIYLKPTTMRGVPLVSLMPSLVMGGFYITRSENSLPSSILTDSSTPSYTTTDMPVEQQTEPILISDISTTDETVTVTRNDRIKSGRNLDVNDTINDKGIDNCQEKYSTPSSSVICLKDYSNVENLSNNKKSDLITIFIDRLASKGIKSLRNFHHTTPLSNSYIASSTTPTRRKIALAVSRYNEATTPLWTGRRIIAKRRNKTTVSTPIKHAIRQTVNDSIHVTGNFPAESASTLVSTRRRKLPTTWMVSAIPSIMPNSTASPEIFNIHNNLTNVNNKTKDPESHATEIEAAMTLTNSVITATPSISKVTTTTNDSTTADISIFSDDLTTTMVPTIANASITTAASVVEEASALVTDATITTTSAITNNGIETTFLNYLITDNPTIENINTIVTNSAATTAFAASTKTEIVSTNVDIVPDATQIIATDPVTKSTKTTIGIEITSTITNSSTIATDPATESIVTNTGIETISTTNYSTIMIPKYLPTNTQEIANDSINMTANTDIDVIPTIANYSAVTIPTTIYTHDIKTDANSIITANTEIETTSMIRNYSTFTTTAIENTTIPVTATAAPLTTVISSTVNTRYVHATVPMTTSNLTDANTNMITTTAPSNVIIPTITDSNIITSTNPNIPSTSIISEISPTMIQSDYMTLSKAPITSTVIAPTNSVAPTTLTAEFSTIHLANPNNFDSSNSKITATAEYTQTEIPMTFETFPIFTSTAAAFPKLHRNTNLESSLSAALSSTTQRDQSFFTPKIIQTPSSLFSTATLIINKMALERSTTSATLSAILDESTTTNPIIRTTTNDYDANSVRTISEEFTTPERKTSFKEATSTVTQSQIEDEIITTINKPSSPRTSNEESTIPEMKIVSKEAVTSKTIKNRKQNQTISELDTINYQSSQKTARRRILNRTNNWLGNSVQTLQTTPSRRPTAYISSTKMTERNHRRRIMQKKIRVNSEVFNSTVRPDQNTVNVQNTTEDYVENYDRIENVRKRKVVLKENKERVKEGTTIILPIKGTTEKIKPSQGSFITGKTNINFNSTSNENLPENSQNNFHVVENLSELEKSKKTMKVVLKNMTSQSQSEETNANSDSINTNVQDNFSKNSYAEKNLSDQWIRGRRMRVVLKSVRPKSKEKSSTMKETNVESDSTDTTLENNLSNNVNTSRNFFNREKPRRRIRVVLKKVKSKSEQVGTQTEEASTEYESNENLQGIFSNNFYSTKNTILSYPVGHDSRKRMKTVLKNVKSEEKNWTVEGTRTRVVLKSIKLKSENENSTVEKTNINPISINKNFRNTFLNNSRKNENLPVEYGTKRRIRVLLKSIKPIYKSEERNLTIEETNVNSDSTDKDLQGSFSNNFHINKNLSDEEETQKETKFVSKSKSYKEKDSIAEKTSADSDFVGKNPQVLYTFHFSSNLHMSDNLLDKEKKHSEEREAMTERPEDTEPQTAQTTRTSVPVDEDTDRPSLEVTNGGISRNVESKYSNRHRKPMPFTTTVPLTSTLSNTLAVRQRGRPVATTLSPRIDFVDALEDTEFYVKPTVVLYDQNADVSDQSTQEFAVTLSDLPSSSSDIGRTLLKDADRRKISTTITPRTDPISDGTVSRYDKNFRSHQRSRTKNRPTMNATTRPRRPSVIDYDYKDETSIIVDKSVLNSKLFLTSKGTIRCLDQGNFPHPYSCKKFITCARMVNGQVVGTEYTCPDKLSFDPVGGICNWSTGLGCKN